MHFSVESTEDQGFPEFVFGSGPGISVLIFILNNKKSCS